MSAFSLWHWLIILAWLVGVGWPVSRILRRMGFSGWWAILAFVPMINLVGLWVVAFIDGPVANAERRTD